MGWQYSSQADFHTRYLSIGEFQVAKLTGVVFQNLQFNALSGCSEEIYHGYEIYLYHSYCDSYSGPLSLGELVSDLSGV